MALTHPTSMEQCVYFTNRKLENDGKAKAWAYRIDCPECGKAKMGKPVNPKTGRPRPRALEYVCPACGFIESKAEHEEKLTVEVAYTCPHCQKEGEGTSPYKRKSFQGVQAFIIECEHCNGKIGITKKMKAPKPKKKK